MDIVGGLGRSCAQSATNKKNKGFPLPLPSSSPQIPSHLCAALNLTALLIKTYLLSYFLHHLTPECFALSDPNNRLTVQSQPFGNKSTHLSPIHSPATCPNSRTTEAQAHPSDNLGTAQKTQLKALYTYTISYASNLQISSLETFHPTARIDRRGRVL